MSLQTKLFISGAGAYLALDSLYQDYVGKETCLKLMETHWISYKISVPIALIILFFCFRFLFKTCRGQNDKTQSSNFDVWGENKRYTRDDWKNEVIAGDTNRGYWNWVDAQHESAADDADCDRIDVEQHH